MICPEFYLHFEFYLELQSRIFKCLPALFTWASHRHSKLLVNTYTFPASNLGSWQFLFLCLSSSAPPSTWQLHLHNRRARHASSCTISTPPFFQPITIARFISPSFLPWALWYSHHHCLKLTLDNTVVCFFIIYKYYYDISSLKITNAL